MILHRLILEFSLHFHAIWHSVHRQLWEPNHHHHHHNARTSFSLSTCSWCSDVNLSFSSLNEIIVIIASCREEMVVDSSEFSANIQIQTTNWYIPVCNDDIFFDNASLSEDMLLCLSNWYWSTVITVYTLMCNIHTCTLLKSSQPSNIES